MISIKHSCSRGTGKLVTVRIHLEYVPIVKIDGVMKMLFSMKLAGLKFKALNSKVLAASVMMI